MVNFVRVGETVGNTIFSGLQQTLRLRTLFCIIAVPIILGIAVCDIFIRLYQDPQILPDGYHATLMIWAISSEIFMATIPIVSVLVFAGNYIDEIKNKFVRFLLSRCNYGAYIASRIVVSFLVGGMVICFGILIALEIAIIVLVPIEQEIDSEKAVAIDKLFKMCFLVFLNGGFWAVVGMTMSTFMESKYIAYASPFVIYYMLVILYERYFPDAYLLYPPNWTNPDVWPYGAWGAAIFLSELTLVFGILFFIRAGRRLRDL